MRDKEKTPDEDSILSLLERKDRVEIAGNRMTYYGSDLGANSLFYWDGNCFPGDYVMTGLDGKISVYDQRGDPIGVQRYLHSWRPDRVFFEYKSGPFFYITETKTIYDDVFTDKLVFTNDSSEFGGDVFGNGSREKDNNKQMKQIKVELSGFSQGKSEVEFKDGYLHLYQSQGRLAGIHRIIGFDKKKVQAEIKEWYRLTFSLELANHIDTSVYLVISMAENFNEALKKYRSALSTPEISFVRRRREWEDYFKNCVSPFSSGIHQIDKLYYHIWYVCKANTLDFSDGNFSHPFTCPIKFRYAGQTFWDTALQAFGEKWLTNYQVARTSILNYLSLSSSDGYLPYLMMKDRVMVRTGCDKPETRLIQPFVYPMAVWDMYLKDGDKKFLEETIRPLIRYDDWLEENRDADRDGLIRAESPLETGWDNSKRLYANPPFVYPNCYMVKMKKYVEPQDLNAYLYLARKLIARIAEELGMSKVVATFQKRAEKTAHGLKSLWDNELGLYCDVFEDDHRKIKVKTPCGMIPMLTGVSNRKQIERIVNHLANPNEFQSEFPIPILSMDDPGYTIRDEYASYQNGRVWPAINWLVVEGLCRYGHYGLAGEIIKKTLDMCVVYGEPYVCESNNPRTGGHYLRGCMFTFEWGTMYNDMLIRRIMGIQPNIPQGELYLRPIFPSPWERAEIERVKIGPHTVGIKIERKSGKLLCRFTHAGSQELLLRFSGEKIKIRNKTVSVNGEGWEIPHWLNL